MIKATSPHPKIDKTMDFSSPTLKLCPGICWAPKVPEWAHTHLPPTPEHPWPGAQVRWGIAISTQLQAHSSGIFYAILEQLFQHNVTTAHQQKLPSTPTMLFLCCFLLAHYQHLLWPHSPPNFMYTVCKSFNLFAPLAPSLPLPQTLVLLLVPSSPHSALHGPPQALAHSYLYPSSGGSLDVLCPTCSCFKGCFHLPLDS